jgi:hypothetical protein
MLYKVWRKNDGGFKLGDIYRKFDDGFEKVVMEWENGRGSIVGYTGLVIPLETLMPYVIRIQKGGVDERALRERQKDV